MTTEHKLSNRIAELYKSAEWEQDRLSDDITLDKMSFQQRLNLAAMIDHFSESGDASQQEPGYILANVRHDLNGLKAGFLRLPESKGFSPRSSGYAIS